jgi:hypothetical protein
MPITYVIDSFRQRMWTHATGLVTVEDVAAHLDAEARDHGLGLPELCDAREATTNITAPEVRQLVHRARRLIEQQPFGPTAIVTINDVAFGMARMFAILVERLGVAVEVFRDVDSGWAWLDEVAHKK